MILSFNHQFVYPILSRVKIHTIREDSHNRWYAGRKIHFATGVRSANYNQFYEDICVSTQEIKIRWDAVDWLAPLPWVYIDGEPLVIEQKKLLAINDGFKGLTEFNAWFNKDFKGKIIHWTNFRYEFQRI